MSDDADEMLKPCPFCGGEASIVGYGPYRIGCRSCGTRGTAFYDMAPDKATAAWNRRPAPAEDRGEVVAWDGHPTPAEAAADLRAFARGRRSAPGDNIFDDAAAIIDRLYAAPQSRNDLIDGAEEPAALRYRSDYDGRMSEVGRVYYERHPEAEPLYAAPDAISAPLPLPATPAWPISDEILDAAVWASDHEAETVEATPHTKMLAALTVAFSFCEPSPLPKVTEAMVEAGAGAIYRHWLFGENDPEPVGRKKARVYARAALEAALALSNKPKVEVVK